MRVALDAQLTVGTATGIGEYVRGLSDALRRMNVDFVALRETRLDPWRFDRRVVWDQAILPLRARECGADLLHCASGTVPLRVGMPIVVTVHDVAWLHVQAHARAYARYYFGAFSLARYRRARAIVADSVFSRNAVLALLRDIDPQRVTVVYPGVAGEFCDLVRSGGDGRTIAVVGTVERRKNLELLVRVLPQLPDARIVAVGPRTEYAEHCIALARRLNVEQRFELRGYVSRDELVALYGGAAVVAVPSRYEGFGYAAAQALCAGVPCVVSDQASLPEIAGDAAAIAPVDDVDAWATLLRSALRGDGDERAARSRAGAIARFSWDASATAMVRVYRASA